MEHDVVARDNISVQNAKDSVDSLFNLIVDSETFRGAPVMRRLLLYLWRHRGESVSEYAIGVDALG